MKPRNKAYLRPRCENCGARIYPIRRPFGAPQLGSVPSHCPNCGEQISHYKKEYLIEREALGCLLACIVFLAIVIITFIIFTPLN